MSDAIRFYRVKDDYGCFSNFAAYPIEVEGKTWPTSEHYFQAQKFVGTEHEEEIRQTESPMEAARMGRERDRPLRSDWETVKDALMRAALRAKFTQHDSLKETLLGTGESLLIEHTKNDHYWGDGGDGSGKNRLGLLLMELREELRTMEVSIDFFRHVLGSSGKSWVLFDQGTAVTFQNSETSPPDAAREVLRSMTAIQPGTPSADFEVLRFEGIPGWAVVGSRSDVMTHVGEDEFGADSEDWSVGLYARAKITTDIEEQQVVHVEEEAAG